MYGTERMSPAAVVASCTANTTSAQSYKWRLPIDVILEIIEWTTSQGELSKLSLVSKMFRDLVRPQLYKSVCLSSAEQIICLSATLSRNPSLGCIIRDLCIFLSVIKRDTDPVVPGEDDAEDDVDGCWTPNTNESSSDSASEDSDLDPEIGSPDQDSGELPIYSSLTPEVWRERMQAFVRDATPPPEALVATASEPGPSNIQNCLQMDATLLSAVTFESIVYAHACSILGACPFIQSLYVPWTNSPCFQGLSRTTQLQELAIYTVSDLPLTCTSSSLSPRTPPWSFMDLTSVQRLTVFDIAFFTNYSMFSAEIPHIFPILTHLRMSLCVFDGMMSCLSRLTRLTHLWLIPPRRYLYPQMQDLENLSRDLQQHCPRLVRVRIDIPWGTYDVMEVYEALDRFPFLRFRNCTCIRHEDAGNMWVTDLKNPHHNPSLAGSGPLYNIYAEELQRYWDLRSTGGGWDG